MLFYIMVTLCLSASLADEENLEHNPRPCMTSKEKKACETFLYKHVNKDAPTTLDQNRWQTFMINNKKLCNRPVQSFLPFAQKQQVLGVCTPSGGKIYEENMCVSKVEFSFITVRVNNTNGACMVFSVKSEKKYIILGCDKINNVCCPVHFETNPKNVGPADWNRNCEATNLAEHVKSTLGLPALDFPALDLSALGLPALGLPALGLLVLTLLVAALLCCRCLSKTKEKSADHKK